MALPPDYFFYMAPTRFWPSFALSTLAAWRRARGADLVHDLMGYARTGVVDVRPLEVQAFLSRTLHLFGFRKGTPGETTTPWTRRPQGRTR